MNMTLFSKARTLILSNLNMLLDAGLNANDVETLRQHIRDLGEATESIEDQAAASTGRVANFKRQIADMQLVISSTTEDIDILLGDNDPENDKFALPLEKKLMRCEEDLAGLIEQMAAEEQTETNLKDAATKVAGRYEEALTKLKRLEGISRTADAQEKATAALRAASTVAGDSPNLDNMEDQIRERGAVASARFDKAVGGMSGSAEQAVAESKAAARLAERRARLQDAAAPAASNSAAA